MVFHIPGALQAVDRKNNRYYLRPELLACRRPGFEPWVGKIPWRREWLPTPVLLPGDSHGQRSLVGYSLWGRRESDTTEQLTPLLKPEEKQKPDNNVSITNPDF